MRRVRYRVAASLDGYIAGPNGDVDWIVHDPNLDFASIYAGFDTVLLGRKTYELTRQPGAPPWPAGWRIHVFSRTLNPTEHPDVTIVSSDVVATVAELRSQPGLDIWLFGGGNLFSSLLAAGLVDQVEVALIPVLLGEGIPLLGAEAPRTPLTLVQSDRTDAGIVNLVYTVQAVNTRGSG